MEDIIELWAFLKMKGLVGTGGQAKMMIREGKVLLNGQTETRKRKKLVKGDIIEVSGVKYIV